jgi:hypothetical protein
MLPQSPQFKTAEPKPGDPFKGNKLYHGTPAPLKPGDIVRPRNRKLGASATPDFRMAKGYANSRYLPLPSLVEKGYKPRVYKVEPVSSATHGKFKGKEVNDKQGFRVIKEVRSGKVARSGGGGGGGGVLGGGGGLLKFD